jgi:hypothetical protein
MSRNRVAERGEQIYAYLKTRQGKSYRRHELLRELRIEDGSTTEAAFRHARDLAEADGLLFPVPCPQNGFTYTVTADPTAALDPALFLARTEQGVRVTTEIHEDFMRSRFRAMDAATRRAAKAWLDFEDVMRKAQEGAAALTKAMVAMRRDGRDDQND